MDRQKYRRVRFKCMCKENMIIFQYCHSSLTSHSGTFYITCTLLQTS
jgi:hypothetical protein